VLIWTIARRSRPGRTCFTAVGESAFSLESLDAQVQARLSDVAGLVEALTLVDGFIPGAELRQRSPKR